MTANERGQIITFYSYKGGTGRSMALANIGYLLAERKTVKKGVLVVDWDLEAPGLHEFFRNMFTKKYSNEDDAQRYIKESPGLIDLFIKLDELTQQDNYNSEKVSGQLFEKVGLSNYILQTDLPSLHLIKAGCSDKDYSTRVNAFSWEHFYDRVPWLMPSFAERLSEIYDYVLIDSRSGITDISGICTMLIPEKLVLVFTPNRQSLNGVLELIPKTTNYRKQSDDLRPLGIFPLPSRIESTESSLCDEWRYGNMEKGLKGYQPQFEYLFKKVYDLPECSLDTYFSEVQIQHVPAYAFGEDIAVKFERRKDRLSLARSYESFTNQLVNHSGAWESKAPSIYSPGIAPIYATSQKFSSVRELIEQNNMRAKGKANEYLEALIEAFEEFRVDPKDDAPLDEKIINSITEYTPCRNDFVDLIRLICLYTDDIFYFDQVFDFFEKSIGYMYYPEGTIRYQEKWYDNYRFILRELFLYMIAVLIEYKKHDEIDSFLDQKYYFFGMGEKRSSTFIIFDEYLRSLDEDRKKRLNLRSISVHADLLKERANIKEVTFDEIMQADFILTLRSTLSPMPSNQSLFREHWFPRSLVYANKFSQSGFDLFFKAQSVRHFDRIKRLLKIKSKDDLVNKFEIAKKVYEFDKWRFDFRRVPFESLMNLKNLNTE